MSETMTEHAEVLGRRADNSDWLDKAARAGLVAYGVVHIVLAWLVLQLAFGDREGTPSSTGAVKELAQQPFGEVLVWAIGVGMFLLVIWQGIEALVGHRDHDGFGRVRRRLVSAGKAVIYGAIGVSAIKVAIGAQTSSSTETESWTARALELPAGQVLVTLVGVAIIAVGVGLCWRAWTGRQDDELNAEGRSGTSGTAFLAFGKVGATAKGVAFGIVGALFIYAGLSHDPEKSGGLDQALFELLDKPFGPALLALIAVGIGCYGLFCFARARHLSR